MIKEERKSMSSHLEASWPHETIDGFLFPESSTPTDEICAPASPLHILDSRQV